MTGEDLFRIIGSVDDDLLAASGEETKTVKSRRNSFPVKGRRLALITAACITVLIGTGLLYARGLKAGREDDKVLSGALGAVGVFTNYAGPILPLVIEGGGEEITASRHISFDLSQQMSDDGRIYEIGQRAFVTDRYTLTNSSLSDKTVDIAYPFAGSLDGSAELVPQLSGDLSELSCRLPGNTRDLTGLSCWEEYSDLLKGESCLTGALAEELPAESSGLADMEVTVYTFEDVSWPHENSAAVLALEFFIPEGTLVITNGINGMDCDTDTAFCRLSYFLSHSDYPTAIFLGTPPENCSLAGYVNGACDEPLEEISASVRVETRVLSDVLLDCISSYTSSHMGGGKESAFITPDLEYKALLSALNTALGDDRQDRDSWTRLDDLIRESLSANRVLCLTAKITVPAGKSVTVTARCVKEASCNYYGMGNGGDTDIYGYDMLSGLGTGPIFTEQTASLTLPDGCRVTGGNFGLGAEGDPSGTVLSSDTPHYYFDINYLYEEE